MKIQVQDLQWIDKSKVLANPTNFTTNLFEEFYIIHFRNRIKYLYVYVCVS